MGQQINDNYTLLAGLPIDDRIQKPTIAERDAISQTRRFQGLKCFVVQTQTEYMLVGGVLNSNWVGTAGANVTGALETIIDGFYALTAGKSTLLDWEVGDKFRGWIGDRYLVGTILTLPVSLPSDIDNSSKVDLAVDSNDIVSDRPIVTTSDYIDVTQLDGSPAKILGENISLSVIPPVHHFTPVTTNIKGYFQGVDNALGDISATTAGITTRVWFTADQTTITAGTFDLTNGLGKGTALSHIQSVTNDDNQKKYFTTDLIGIPHPIATIYPVGVYAGNLSASTTPNSAQQRFTVELYKCDNGGTPIASGITGAPVGSLGVTVITILDSGLLTLLDGSVTNVPVSGNLASPLSMAAGERVRYHVSAEKVGTAASNITQSVYYGANYNSYLDVTVPLNTTAVQNLSNVVGATTTDALNNLKTGLDTKLNKTYESNFDIADNTSTISGTTFDAFGILVQTFSNKLISIYREGAGHLSNDGKIVMRTSTDGGKTFSARSIIHSEVAGVDCRNVGGGVTPTGRIIIFFLKVNNVVPTFYSQGTMYSDDDGATWSAYTPQMYPVGSTFYSPYGNLIAIANDRLLLPYYSISPSGGIASMVKFSDDDGLTWGGDVTVGTDPTNGYNETSFAYLDGGTILAVARKTDTSILRQFLSTDNGETWTDQGNCGLSESGLISPWLNVYRETDGEKYVSLFYTAKAVVRNILAISASRTSVIAGASGWISETKKTVVTGSGSGDFGYPSFVNPRFGKKMLGMYYTCPDSSNPLSAIGNYTFFNYQPSAIYYKGSNTGFGTNNPNWKTHIDSGSGNNYISLTNSNTGSGANDGFLLGVDMASGVQLNNRENTAIQIFTNNTERFRFHANGGISIGNTTSLGAGTLNVTGNITTIAATTANHAVIKSQLDAVASSGTFTPSTVGSFTFSKSYWVKVGNVVTCTVNGTYSTSVSGSATLPLPNSFTINTPVNGRIIGTSPLLVLGSVNTRYAAVEEHTTNSQVTIRIETSVGSNVFSIPFTFLAN